MAGTPLPSDAPGLDLPPPVLVKTRRRKITPALSILVTVVGVLAIMAGGWMGSNLESLRRLSYDWNYHDLFFFPRYTETPEICLVEMDDDSAGKLGQRYGVWDRRVHARLIRRMTQEGARAVFLDLVFFDPAMDPAADAELAAAMKENGSVFIGAQLELPGGVGGPGERVLAPVAPLRRAAAGWGVLAFRPLDPDYAVRRLYTGTENVPTATWRMAQKLGASLPTDPLDRLEPTLGRAEVRWMNYYNPREGIQRVRYDRVLEPNELPTGFFKNKIVFVGSRAQMGKLGEGKDEFRKPTTRWQEDRASGVEVHATAFLNLLHGEWLRTLPERWENAAIIGTALLLGLGLPRLRPWLVAVAALLYIVAVSFSARWLVAHERYWFNWMSMILVQAPVSVAFVAASRYLLVARRRSRMHKALRGYLSPEMADRIDEFDFDLSPGGRELEVTVVFTDLEGFTTLSETLSPSQLSKVLTEYFTRTSEHVLSTRGTIVKFIGDAVLAVWGAPFPDEGVELDAVHAARAACAMERSGSEPFEHEGRSFALRTRVGIHTGRVLSGNLGSALRFDYSVIGDTVNFASRLEGLNKYLGTNILISETTQRLLGERFVTRAAGTFRVVGKTEPVSIYELLAPASEQAAPAWVGIFDAGLMAFRQGDWVESEARFREVLSLRGPAGDGPARFYLEKLPELKTSVLPAGWSGVVELTSK